MIKSLIHKLFLSDEKRNEIIKDLKNNPNFKTKDEINEHRIDSTLSNFKLEKGKVESVLSPDLGNLKGLILTKWYVKPGDIVKSGDIVCQLENENITMEFESFYSGKIVSTCRLNQKLTSGIEIFKMEGV
ncbi:biotin/lipoyl-containing protein [Ulvibacterium marinum]|uniref:biotin/lipoyl-containing protein n=1 Tax=Ulvibacterium marinum TaxID=2419782 RepID=UPI002494CB6E|nr:biotin/lipoyl-containing protein [Ulvibacterium marinum]